MIKKYTHAPAGKQSFVTIEIPVSDIEELAAIQFALIDLISRYDYSLGSEYVSNTMYYATELLKSLLPDHLQMEKGTIDNDSVYHIPENISPEFDKGIREILSTFRMENSGINRKKVLENLLNTI